MARPLRIELAGGLYHVTARGDRREDIYESESDRIDWLSIFGEVCQRFNWRCHAYCQMTNHYHLVVETIEGNLSLGMRHLNGVYTQPVASIEDAMDVRKEGCRKYRRARVPGAPWFFTVGLAERRGNGLLV